METPYYAMLKIIVGHEEATSMICCSKDSRIILTGDTTGVAKVWSVTELIDSAAFDKITPLYVVFDCHDMGVNSADISPITTITTRGKVYTMLTCGNDHLVKIWQLTLWKTATCSHQCTVEMVRPLKGHSSSVTSLCFDEAGKMFASTSMDKTTRLWRMIEPNDAVCLKVLEGHTRYVNTCGFSRDNLLFATGSNDKSVIIWDVKGELDLYAKLDDSEEIESMENTENDRSPVEVTLNEKLNRFTNAVNSCDFGIKYEHLVAAGSDKVIRVWNFHENGRSEECKSSPLRVHNYSVQQIVVSPCSSYMASCSLDGTTIIWELNTLEQKGSLHADYGGARSCSFSGNSKLIAVACDNEMVYVWAVNTLQLVAKLSGNNEDVTCVSFSPDSRYLMSGCVEGHFRIWSVHPKKCIVSNTSTIIRDNAHEIGITSADFAFKNPSKKRSLLMLTGGNDAVVKTWKLLDDRIDFKMKFVGHGSDITCVKFPRNITTFLASTSLDKTARIWQTKTGDCLHVIDPKNAILTCCSFSPNNKILATGSLDKALFLWNLPLDDSDETSIRKSASLAKYKMRSDGIHDKDSRELEKALMKLSPSVDIPDEFVCPITRQVFRDPVICADGYTYERSAIVSWFRRGKITSPLTNEPLLSKSMTPNEALREVVAAFVQQDR
ncbi:Hypothetical protein CINCED_3A006655 [Cinara cedri]|uniref:U-box domain-containing protein n=1 Tax=Cinara cedri TaxID=506608 RepID=A0A5E4MU21_9HEMI|nr:Hypothetical protein CINCED_3A006655 [Cinara cedri]